MTTKNLLLGIPISLAGLLISVASIFADILRGGKFSVGPAQYAAALLGFLVFLLGLGIVKKSYPYEFCNPYKAIERGVSVCSQASKIIIYRNHNKISFLSHSSEGVCNGAIQP